jgi:hypothetical protein
MSRLISVSDLNIKTRVKPNGRGTVTATCVATTFVFRKDSAPATPAAVAPGQPGQTQPAPAKTSGGRP